MTVKYLHIRELEPNGDISSFGGMTIAYVIVDSPGVAGIAFNLVKCHPDDRFNFATGRELASKKLNEEGPLEVLPLEHPISHTIIDYVANVWCPSRRKYCGYAIDVIPDHKHRWFSTFTPAQSEIRLD